MQNKNLLSKLLLKTIKSLEDDGRLTLIQNSQVFPLSTGSLSLDYFYGGGVIPAMYTISGVEQSGKTLTASSILASAYKQGITSLFYFDAEGTLNSKLLKNLFNVDDLSSLITVRKEGRNELLPPLTICQGNSLEGVMDGITAICNTLPDKIYIDQEDDWYYRIPKDDKAGKEFIDHSGLEVNEKLSKQISNGKFLFCKDPTSKAKSSGVQAMIVIDSLASLITDTEEEDGMTQQMSLEARRFSKHLKRFVTRLAKKQVVLIGINQTRENPNVRYGSPSYEPGGTAIRFLSSTQVRANSIAPSTAKYDGQDKEPSSINPELNDRYQFKKFKFTKDKISGGINRELILRIWIEDALGEARGIDPVLDTTEFLKMTNQWEENRGRIHILNHPVFSTKSLTWKQFKKLVLAFSIDHDSYKNLKPSILEELGLNEENGNIRKWCFDQITSRTCFASKDLKYTELSEEELSTLVDEDGVPLEKITLTDNGAIENI